MPKFFVDREQISDGFIKIYGDDAKHISYSLRMAKGECITVCDKSAREYDCRLVSFEETCVVAEILGEQDAPGEPPLKISLFQGLPKGDKLETVIQKAVECGVTEIIPFESERCIAKSKSDTEGRKTERRNRIAVEAAKQCGRGCIPQVKQTIDFADALREAAKAELALICYEDEDTTSLKQALVKAKEQKVGSIAIMIGSEGGFSRDEVKLVKALGIFSVSLGKRILRTETAPVFVLSCMSYEFEL